METQLTVLVVEDDPAQQRVIGAMLVRLGCAVLSAGDGEEALKLLRGAERPIDVLLADVVMPSLTGPMLAEQLRASHPRMRVVFMSGYSSAVLQWYDLDPAQVSFLQKPFAPEELERVLSDAGASRG